MAWQDYALTICIISFSYALMPQIYQGYKKRKCDINLQTSFIPAIGLYFLTFIYFTLTLYISAFMAAITGTLWLTLFVQKIIY